MPVSLYRRSSRCAWSSTWNTQTRQSGVSDGGHDGTSAPFGWSLESRTSSPSEAPTSVTDETSLDSVRKRQLRFTAVTTTTASSLKKKKKRSHAESESLVRTCLNNFQQQNVFSEALVRQGTDSGKVSPVLLSIKRARENTQCLNATLCDVIKGTDGNPLAGE